ncbi:MAG: DUF6519 domain-containing protein [Cyanobacteria bacterium P01_F01_bin.53]
MMTTADISRFLFQPEKRYSSVQMQQGRVILDSDWNEFERLDHEFDRQTIIDILCAKGTSNDGFRIGVPRTAIVDFPASVPDSGSDNDVVPVQVVTYDFDIASGSFYLGGLRFENSGQGDSPVTVLNQPDWLQVDANPETLPVLPVGLEAGAERYDLVYLRGWEQCVSAVEDSELKEQALGGPDTSVRVRRMQRVEILPDVADSCAEAFAQLQQQLTAGPNGENNNAPIHAFDDRTCELQSAARLTVTLDPDGLAEDPCRPAGSSGYLGADNQTIRVQLTAANRLIWSYDNASPLYRVQVSAADLSRVTFLTLPCDQESQPLAGQAVEIIPWGALLSNQEKVAEVQGEFFTVATSYNPADNTLTLAQPVDQAWTNWLAAHPEYYSDRDAPEQQQYFYLRLWTGGAGEADSPDIEFTPGEAVALAGTGLSVTLSATGIPGDFWVMAARPNTPNIIVPWTLLEAAPPSGPKNYFAPLALVRWQVNENNERVPAVVQDCRDRFVSLCQSQSNGCCTVTVGDGQSSQGLFNAIEDAIAALPPEGGKICVLPGRHRTNAVLQDRQNIQITGCGFHTIIQPRPGQANQPLFRLESSRNIQLDHMTMVAQARTAVQVIDPESTPRPSQGISILWNRIVACEHAVEIRVNNRRAGNNTIWIAHNQMALIDRDTAESTLFCIADDVLIERNRLVVLPPPRPDDPQDPRNPDDFDSDVFDDCLDPDLLSDNQFRVRLWLAQTFQFVAQLAFLPPRTYEALGGIQIGGGSEQVTIRHNEIFGGAGNGITLGNLPAIEGVDAAGNPLPQVSANPFVGEFANDAVRAAVRARFESTLYDITIEHNTIESMGLSGIGVVLFANVQTDGLMIRVDTLTIHRNHITRCLQQPPRAATIRRIRNVGLGGISLAACDNVRISENRIEQNGISSPSPTCGIFILLGEQVTIRANHILGNGLLGDDQQAQPGLRGGIVIACLSSRVGLLAPDDDTPLPANLGVGDALAATVQGNIVSQPLSQALTIFAVGPLLVTDNVFASQDIDVRANPFGRLSGAVLIVNLGFPIQDILGGIGNFLISSQNQSNQQPATAGSVQAGNNALVARQPEIPQRLLFWPSGNVLFNDNQTVFDLREVNGRTVEADGAFSAQFIFSLDDVSFQGNQSDCNFLLDLLLTNVFIFGISSRVSNNRLKEGFLAYLSIFSLSFMNITTYNQCSHCAYAKGNPAFETETGNQILYPGAGFAFGEAENFCELINNTFDLFFDDDG